MEDVVAVGRVASAIALLGPAVHAFLVERAKKTHPTKWHEKYPDLDGKKLRDFAELMKYVKTVVNDLAAPRKALLISRLAERCFVLRHQSAHQNLTPAKATRGFEHLRALAVAIDRLDVVAQLDALPKPGAVPPPIIKPATKEAVVSPAAASPLAIHAAPPTAHSPVLTVAAPTPDPAPAAPASGTWQSLKERGNELYRRDDFTGALEIYTEALRLAPTEAILYSNRALCALKLSQWQFAREDAEDAINLDPKQVKYHRVHAEALFELKLYEEAVWACSAGLAIDPRDATLLRVKRDSEERITHKKTMENVRDEPAHHAGFLRDTHATNSQPPVEDDIETVLPSQFAVYEEGTRLCLGAHAHMKKDLRKAVDYLSQAADKGCAEGHYNLALCIDRGWGGLTRDLDLHIRHLQTAASQKPYLRLPHMIIKNIGVAEAANALGTAYRDGRGVDKSATKAVEWFLKSATWGCAEGQNNLGYCLMHGYGIAENHKTARHWYQLAAKNGATEANVNLAGMLEQGLGGEIDLAEAEKHYKIAAAQGLPEGMTGMQRMAAKSASSQKKCEVRDQLAAQAEARIPEALFQLARNYHLGEGGVAKDEDMAAEFYSQAVEKGHLLAHYYLGKLRLKQKQAKEAIKLLSFAAEHSHPKAQYRLAELFAFGHGCERDAVAARRWWKRALLAVAVNPHEKTSAGNEDPLQSMIDAGEQVCTFEAKKGLSFNGCTLKERQMRFLREAMPNSVPPEIEDVFGLLQQLKSTPKPSLAPFHGTDLTKEHIEDMGRRAKAGSITAYRWLESYEKLRIAEILVGRDELDAAFSQLTQAHLRNDLKQIPPDMLLRFEAASDKLLSTTDNADALFFKAWSPSNRSSPAERALFLQQCIQKHPRRAELHHMLGCMFGFMQALPESERAFKRALELELNPNWLYDLGSTLRLSVDSNLKHKLQEAIAAYKEFLQSVPPDHRKVPEAYYALSSLYLLHENDLERAKEAFKRGEASEATRLPCFAPVSNFPPKLLVQKLLPLRERENSTTLASMGPKCSFCDKPNPPKNCPCGSVFYCNQECQRKHWPTHKTTCKNKKQ